MTNNTIIVIILRNKFIRPSINPRTRAGLQIMHKSFGSMSQLEFGKQVSDWLI